MDHQDSRAYDPGRIVWGGIVILFGLLLLADAVELLNVRFSGPFWPFIFIALGTARLMVPPDPSLGRPRRTGGWMAFIGVWTLRLAGWTTGRRGRSWSSPWVWP